MLRRSPRRGRGCVGAALGVNGVDWRPSVTDVDRVIDVALHTIGKMTRGRNVIKHIEDHMISSTWRTNFRILSLESTKVHRVVDL